MSTKIRLSNLTQPLDQDLSIPNLTANGSITATGDLSVGGNTSFGGVITSNVSIADSKTISSPSGGTLTLTAASNTTELVSATDLFFDAGTGGSVNSKKEFVIRHTNPRLAFVDSSFNSYDVKVNESTGDLELGESSNLALKLHNDGNATFLNDLTVDTDTLYVNSANNKVSIGTTTYEGTEARAYFHGTNYNSSLVKLSRKQAGAYTATLMFEKQKIDANSELVAVNTGDRIMQLYTSVSTGDANTAFVNGPSLVIDATSNADVTTRISGEFALTDGFNGKPFKVDTSGNGQFDGDLTVLGSLTISGNTTTVDTNNLLIEDLNITLANGAVDGSAANGAGITVDGANAQITYVSVNDGWTSNKKLGVLKNPQYNLDVHSNARIGDSSVTGASLIIEASNTAGSSAMTSQMTFIGYEGRGKGIFYNDISYSPTRQWFSGVPYNSTHAYYSIGFGSNQSEYIDQSLVLVNAGLTGTGGVLLGEKNTIRTGEGINTGWNYDVTKLDVRGRLAGGRIHNSDVFTKDLMLYLDFNNIHCFSPELAANGRVNDLSKNNYQIVPAGTATYTTDNGIHVVNLDGDSDYLILNQFNNTDSSLSFEAWFKIDTWQSGGSLWNTIFDLGDQDGNPIERPLLGVLYDGVSAGNLRAYPNTTNFATGLQTGRWYHVVWAFASNTDLDVYLNGERVASGVNWGSTMPTTATATNGDTRLLIGGDGGAEGTDGKIAIVRVYDKQLTSDEVRRNYNADALRFGHGGFLHDNTLYLAQTGSPTIIDKGTKEFNIYTEDGIAFKANGTYTFPMITGDGAGNLELIANARPANTGQNHRIVIKAGNSGGGGPAEIARFIEGTNGVGKLSVGLEAETPYVGYFYNPSADYNANGKPSSTLGIAAYANSINEGPSLDFITAWSGAYHPTTVSDGWVTGRIAGVHDSQTGITDGGALLFYTKGSSNAGTDGGAESSSMAERLRIDTLGRIVVANTGIISLGDVALALPRQAFTNSISAGGADTWYKLCEVDNPWKGEIHYFIGCNNAEEHGVIKVKTTWTYSNLLLEVDRQTYKPMLKEVRLSSPTNGANYEIWVRLNSDSNDLASNPTFRYNIVNAFVYTGGSSSAQNGGVVAYFNTSGTPASDRTSVILDSTGGGYGNVRNRSGSEVIAPKNGAVAMTLQTTSDIALRLHGNNAWTGIQFQDNIDTGTGATDNIFYNGTTATFAIGGGGSSVSGKKLHVDGAVTIGSGYDSFIVPTDGLRVQGDIQGDNTLTIDCGSAYGAGAAGVTFVDGGTATTLATASTFRVSNSGTSPQYSIAEFESASGSTVFYNDGHVVFSGAIYAASKSFDIEHPTKEGMRLRHGSLEGPEHGVYVRGRLTDSNVIVLPDYWTGLVDEDSITVQLTAIGGKQNLWVEDIVDNSIVVGFEDKVNCFYFVQAERKDVEKFDVEYEA